MKERALASVLLVKAVEESDREGVVLALAERTAATREAARAGGERSGRTAPGPNPDTVQRLLAHRAAILHARLSTRFRVVDRGVALARGPAWAAWVLLAAAFILGIALSALDATQRINLVSLPLFGLMLWNLAVYLMVGVGWLRSVAAPRRKPSRATRTLLGAGALLGRRLVDQSSRINPPLAQALARFSGEWVHAAGAPLTLRAVRLFHLCAAVAGVGLVAGLYLRGVALSYEAGWESTFLDAQQVHVLLSWIYAPASAVTGIPVPDAAQLESIRWVAGRGGEGAARWIHLLAATALLFIVLPRLALALVATVQIWHWSRRAVLPPTLMPYFRSLFGVVNSGIGGGDIAVIPYAYEPAAGSVDALRIALPAALGGGLAVSVCAAVPYGEEGAIVERLPQDGAPLPDVVTLLFNLASTPEEENHGEAIVKLRARLEACDGTTQLLLMVDEGPYAARQAASGNRLAERRESWRAFAGAHAMTACIVDLRAAPDASALERMRDALWQATPR